MTTYTINAVGALDFAPFNKTAEQDAITALKESFQPLRDLTPGGGSYLNEVSRQTSGHSDCDRMSI